MNHSYCDEAAWWIALCLGLALLGTNLISCSDGRKIESLQTQLSAKEIELSKLQGDLGICKTQLLDEKKLSEKYKQSAIDQGEAAEKYWSILRYKLDWSKELAP